MPLAAHAGVPCSTAAHTACLHTYLPSPLTCCSYHHRVRKQHTAAVVRLLRTRFAFAGCRCSAAPSSCNGAARARIVAPRIRAMRALFCRATSFLRTLPRALHYTARTRTPRTAAPLPHARSCRALPRHRAPPATLRFAAYHPPHRLPPPVLTCHVPPAGRTLPPPPHRYCPLPAFPPGSLPALGLLFCLPACPRCLPARLPACPASASRK